MVQFSFICWDDAPMQGMNGNKRQMRDVTLSALGLSFFPCGADPMQ